MKQFLFVILLASQVSNAQLIKMKIIGSTVQSASIFAGDVKHLSVNQSRIYVDIANAMINVIQENKMASFLILDVIDDAVDRDHDVWRGYKVQNAQTKEYWKLYVFSNYRIKYFSFVGDTYIISYKCLLN